MRNLYSMCIVSVLFGYIHDVKAHPIGVQCGIVGRRKSRIANGTVAADSQFPWIASIKRNGQHLCGGSIITSKYLISAAHCFHNFENSGWSWVVTLGEYDIKVNETFSANYGIERIIKHPNYGLWNGRKLVENDIVLVELSEEIQWTSHIQPICLPNWNLSRSSGAIAPGWGPDIIMHIPDEENDKLRYVEIDIFESEFCNDIYNQRKLDIKLQKTHMCAGKITKNKEIRDTNQGDSGGPLLVKLQGRQVIVGITSTGVRESFYPKPPGIYTRVFEYMDWIMENIHEHDVHYYPPVLTNKLH